MAPLMRGSANRGRSQFRGNSGGRGRGKWNARSVQGSTIRSTQPPLKKAVVEKSDESHSGEDVQENKSESEISETEQNGSSSEEEQDITAVSVKPYNALLQSLNGNTSPGLPPSKKRRLLADGKKLSVFKPPEVTAHPNSVSNEADVDHEEESKDVKDDVRLGPEPEEVEVVDLDIEEEDSE